MIVDGKAIAHQIQETLKKDIESLSVVPALGIVVVGENAVTNQFVASKKRFAEALGVVWNEIRLPEEVSFESLVTTIDDLAPRVHGLVVQLPLPQHIDTPALLAHIPQNKDVDLLSDAAYEAFMHDTTQLEPPVAGAVREILEAHHVPIDGAQVVVVGRGRLVGAPVAHVLAKKGASVFVVDKATDRALRDEKLRTADIVVSGAGVPELITPELVKEGVVLVDAGTSGAGRMIVGDIALSCESKALVFSKTPGGVGPATVAILFKNTIACIRAL